MPRQTAYLLALLIDSNRTLPHACFPPFADSHVSIMATESSLKTTSHKGQKNKHYSLQFKVEAVNFAEQNSNKKAAEKFTVDRKRIREWRRSNKSLLEEQLKTSGTKRKRIPGGGRKPLDEALEEDLLEWVHNRRCTGLRVSRKLIMRKAKIMHDEKCGRSGAVSDFNASRGWLEKFMSRNGLSLRRKTTQAQQDPTKLIDKLIAYILKIIEGLDVSTGIATVT